MSNNSRIEWTDATWNPIVGCSKCSPGCQNCYAEKMAKRLAAMGQTQYLHVANHSGWNGRVSFVEDALDIPLKWKKPRRIFICSMGDLFHEYVSPVWIDQILEVIAACPQHEFIALTKRAHLLEEKLYGISAECGCRELGGGDYIPNLTLMVTCCTQKEADRNIPLLLQTPAARRGVSLEPLLEQIDLITDRRYLWPGCLDWVIAGCESGPNRRPAHIDWFRSLRDQCQYAHVPFFLKQMDVNGTLVKMPELDGKVWDGMPIQRVQP